MRILIVEDEEHLAFGVKFNLEREGYAVEVVSDGPMAIARVTDAASPIDLVILDLMLPGMSGYEICKSLREMDVHIPILVLSARTLPEDKAHAFDCGTDQYLTKPFDLRELLARVRNLLRRRERQLRLAAAPHTVGRTHQLGNLVIDFRKFEIAVDGEVHKLTTMEMQLLRFFLQHEGEVLSRTQILDEVWGISSDVTTRTIDNFVLRLRKLIERDPSKPVHLLSVRGTGYQFVANPSDANPDLN